MSDRRKPSQAAELRVVSTGETGEILEDVPAPGPVEQLVTRWEQSIYRGSSVLDLPPRKWALPGWLPLDAVISIYGPAGTGKSLYAFALGAELARGGRWVGRSLTAEPVLYVAAERPTDQRDRAEAWVKYHGLELPALFSMLAPSRPPQLTDENHVSALCSLIEQHGARVVILDTFARMTLGLEENSSREMGPVMEALDRIREATRGGLVVLVHHSGKDPGKGMRGSTAMLGALDLTIELSGGTDGIVRASIPKANASAKAAPEWYRIHPEALPALPGELEERSVPVLLPSTRPESTGEDEILEVVAGIGRASRKQIREALEEEHGLELSDSKLSRTLKRMTEAGRIELDGKPGSVHSGYVLPDAAPGRFEDF